MKNNPSPEIIATIGPASKDPKIIARILKAGATMLRLNMSHGTHQEHGEFIAKIRSIAPETKILVDLSGPRKNSATGHAHDPLQKSLTSKDLHDLAFAAKQGVSHIALSYVSAAEDLMELKQELKRLESRATIVAKIEHQTALTNIAEIIAATDEVIIGRGDLGHAIGLEKVPLATLSTILSCRQKNTPCYVATQILTSMLEKKEPTRSEATDAWLIGYSQASGAMLSDETALGKNPDLAVQWLSKLYHQGQRDNREKPFAISSSF